MIHQLRIYEIFEPNKEAFHARFRDHAARIMKGHGFDIVTMWEAKTDARTEFVYLLVKRLPSRHSRSLVRALRAALKRRSLDESAPNHEVQRVTDKTDRTSVGLVATGAASRAGGQTSRTGIVKEGSRLGHG
jgi:hypothetical protein